MLLNWLKFLLPKPLIPQKRYLVLLGIALYYAAKAYVAYTPDPSDDHIPDKVKDAVVTVVGDNSDYSESRNESENDYSDAVGYGEKS